LSYDPLGRLYQVTLGGGTTRFLHDGESIVEERSGSGTLQRRYAHWAGEPAPAEAGVPLLSFTGSDFNSPDYLHGDQGRTRGRSSITIPLAGWRTRVGPSRASAGP
jgi:hypothetical protein